MLIKFFFICAMLFGHLTISFPAGTGLQFVALAAACIAAALAAVRSIDEDRYLWFSSFIAIAVLLNPVGALWLARTPLLVMLGIGLTSLSVGWSCGDARFRASRSRRCCIREPVVKYLEDDGIARVSGIRDAMAGEMPAFSDGLLEWALNLDEDSIGVVLPGRLPTREAGRCRPANGRVMSLPGNEALIGRVVNALGHTGIIRPATPSCSGDISGARWRLAACSTGSSRWTTS